MVVVASCCKLRCSCLGFDSNDAIESFLPELNDSDSQQHHNSVSAIFKSLLLWDPM